MGEESRRQTPEYATSTFLEELEESTNMVLRVMGEVDLFTAPDFKQQVNELVAATRDGRIDSVTVDLSECALLDVSALGILIGAHRQLRKLNTPLNLRNPTPSIENTLRITGLNNVFNIERTEPDYEATDEPADPES